MSPDTALVLPDADAPTQLAEFRGARPGNMLRPLSRHQPPVNGALHLDVVTLSHCATISAGELVTQGDKTFPQPSRDGKIILHDEHGRAPGLRAVLEERQYKSLVIGFAWNPTVRPDGSLDVSRFVVQRMAAYTKGSLRFAGDETGLTSWEDGRVRRLEPDTPDFAKAWRQCYPETWVYFHLAAIDPVEGPQLVFPDNTTVPYRLRFGAANSRRELDACLQGLVGLGQVAFMPILLQIDPKRPVVLPPGPNGQSGKRGTAPVWTFAPLLAPEGTRNVTISSRRLLAMRGLAREQSQMIALPEPIDQSTVRALVLAEGGGPIGDDEGVTQEQLERMARAAPCNADRWRKVFHAIARDTPAGTDEARHRFIGWYTQRHPDLPQTQSLKTFLETATEAEAADLIDSLLALLERRTAAPVDADGVVHEPSPSTADAPPSVAVESPDPVSTTDAPPVVVDAEPDHQPPDDWTEAPDVDDAPPVDVGTLDVVEWLSYLGEQYEVNVAIDSKPRQRKIAELLTTAVGVGKPAEQLLRELCGVETTAELTIGMTTVLLEASKRDDWTQRIADLRAEAEF